MLEELLKYDKEVFLMLNNLGTSTWDGFWMFITNKFSSIPLYLLLIFLSFKQFGTKRTLVLVITAILMIVVTNGLADFFKYGIGRLRPCYDADVSELMRLVKSYCGGKYGYFSGHSSNSMGVAILVGLMLKDKYKYMIYFLILWAILMGYSRIYIGVHYPLDVLSGFLFGGFSGFMFYKLDKYLQSKFTLREVDLEE